MGLPKYEASRNRVYRRYKLRANERGILFTLSKHEFTTICERNCHYCGAKPTESKAEHHKKLNGSWKYNGLDRIDNTKGYLLSNVQACCFLCNQLKSNREEKEFLSQIATIALNMGLGFKEED